MTRLSPAGGRAPPSHGLVPSRGPCAGRALLGQLADEGRYGPSSEDLWNARARRLLRREAIRLILDPDFPDDPFSR